MAKKFEYDDYEESAKVKDYAAQLAANKLSKPTNIAGAVYKLGMDKAMYEYNNYKDFKYDLDNDALYQQYKDQYIQQGKTAMQDTIGQASAMTGGYANSYAQTVGNQAYQAQLQNLNDVVPELYQMAYNQYRDNKNDLLNEYNLLSDRYNTEYGEYRDKVADWQNQRDYLTNQYNAERNYDYTLYSDGRDFAYSDYRNQVADEQWLQEYNESVRQYNATLAQQQAEFAESQRQYNQDYALRQAQLAENKRKNAQDYAIEQAKIAEDRRQYNNTLALQKKNLNESPSATKEKTYNNGMTASQIASAAKSYVYNHPEIATDSMTIDYWLNDNGYSGESAKLFKAYMQQYGAKTKSRN